MKYRRLEKDELKELEPEFIEFLASNSVTGDDWIKLKRDEPEKAEDLIEIFSDIVMERALSRIECLEKREEKDWKIFNFEKEKVLLVGLSVPIDSELDLTKEITTQDLFEGKVEIYGAEKSYNESREIEIFDLIESGCSIADTKVFQLMKDLLDQSE